MTLDVLFIDNFDSFTFNLVDEFAKRGANVEVWRNDISAEDALHLLGEMSRERLLVLSPGPGSPGEAGCCLELVRRAPEGTPILGVCLGHQAIVEAFGGRVTHAPQVMHGMASILEHDGRGIFRGLPDEMSVARYHCVRSRFQESSRSALALARSPWRSGIASAPSSAFSSTPNPSSLAPVVE